MKYAWIEAPIDSDPIRLTCELLGVSPSGFYAARSRSPSARAVEQAQIVTEIRRAQTRHRGRHGRRWMTTEVRGALNRPVNEKRTGRLMREQNLRSRQRRRFHVVTGLEACPPGSAEHPGTGFRGHRAEPEVVGGPDRHPDRRGLAVPGPGAGSVLAQTGWLDDE